MSRNRRSTSQFNLSFLDVMCCGFGAVVLLVMLLNGDMIATRQEIVADLRSEVTRLEREVKVGTEHLVSLQNSMVQTEAEIVRTEGLSEQVIASLEQTRVELATMSGKSQAARKHINALQSDLLNLDKESQRIGAEQQTELARGAQVREFIGQGDRQYLTGLRLGGKRVLLLVDASASMLDETIVNIIVRRNLDDQSEAGRAEMAAHHQDRRVADGQPACRQCACRSTPSTPRPTRWSPTCGGAGSRPLTTRMSTACWQR